MNSLINFIVYLQQAINRKYTHVEYKYLFLHHLDVCIISFQDVFFEPRAKYQKGQLKLEARLCLNHGLLHLNWCRNIDIDQGVSSPESADSKICCI